MEVWYKVFSFSGDCVVTLLGWWGPLYLSDYPTEFWSYRWCEILDITFLNCRVTARSSYHSAELGSHRWCGHSDVTFFLRHVTTGRKGHVTWWLGLPHPINLGGSRSERCNISNSNSNVYKWYFQSYLEPHYPRKVTGWTRKKIFLFLPLILTITVKGDKVEV